MGSPQLATAKSIFMSRKSAAFLLSFLGVIFQWAWLELTTFDKLFPQLMADGKPNNMKSIKYEVVATNYGWTTPADTNFSRRIVTGEFFNAVVSHSHYNSSAWSDLEEHPDPTRRIVAFMDIDSCLELNYPSYGGRDWWKNIEKSHPTIGACKDILYDSCQYIRRAATSQALLANPDSRLIVLDCSGGISSQLRNICRNDPNIFGNDQVVMAYISAHRDSARPQDVGLPPPAIKPINLPGYEKYLVQSCQKRKYLFSFQGRGRYGREQLLALNEKEDMYVRLRGQRSYLGDIKKDIVGAQPVGDSNNYTGIMADSVFAGSPKGDNLFSYRFAEILSAGTVPVVYADGWLPPFNQKVVDWTKCAVFIPESDFNKTEEILRAIPDNVKCEMQKCALDVWDKFVSSRSGWVRGLVEAALSQA